MKNVQSFITIATHEFLLNFHYEIVKEINGIANVGIKNIVHFFYFLIFFLKIYYKKFV